MIKSLYIYYPKYNVLQKKNCLVSQKLFLLRQKTTEISIVYQWITKIAKQLTVKTINAPWGLGVGETRFLSFHNLFCFHDSTFWKTFFLHYCFSFTLSTVRTKLWRRKVMTDFPRCNNEPVSRLLLHRPRRELQKPAASAAWLNSATQEHLCLWIKKIS